MRPDLVQAVRGTLERGVDDETATALLDFAVGDVISIAAAELANAIGPRDVASQRRAIESAGLVDAMATTAVIAAAYSAAGNPTAGCAELLCFLEAFALDVDERARAIVRRDALVLDRQVADATRRCRWRGGRRGR